MSAFESQDRRGDKKNGLLEHLHNPTELRLFLLAVILGIGYSAIYMPLDKTIAATTRKLQDSRKRLTLADEVEALRKQFRSVQSRIPENSDTNEWMQYVLGGLRQSPLKLESFSPGQAQAIGSYQVINIKIKVSGSFSDLDQFIYWLESNPRLFRVESVKMAPGGSGADAGDIGMDVTIIGIVG
jgi:Tfp pilus assembly protein PilO